MQRPTPDNPRPTASLLKHKFSAAASGLSSIASAGGSAAASGARRGLKAWQERRAQGGGRERVDGYAEGGEITLVDHGDGEGVWGAGEWDQEKMEQVLERVIFQAGVDYETRPMIVITAAALPDPREVSYDYLLSAVLSTLDLYVESDYTVVFLASGGRYTPGWNWVWKAYRSLSRKYRKNLKKLYIVHSTLFSKMLVSLAGAIISPKFFRKIQYINTLSALARVVPITQIDIAPEVYRENLKHEPSITLPEQHPYAAVFGVPLDELGPGIPQVLKDCGSYILTSGLVVEGLFRRSPSSALLRQAQEAYDRGHPVTLSSFGDPHIAAVLLKKFFHDLPQPVVQEEMYAVVRRCPVPSEDPADVAAVMYIRDTILPMLPEPTVRVLSYALHLMHDVSLHSHINKMDASNLALCFCPNLVSSRNPALDVQMCMLPGSPSSSVPIPTSPPTTPTLRSPGGTQSATLALVLKICIERYFEIFDDPELDPPVPTTVRPLSASLPGNHISSDQEDDMDDTILVMSVDTSPSAGRGSGSARKFTPGHRRTDTQDSEVSLGSLLSEPSDAGHGKILPPLPGPPTHSSPRATRSLFSPSAPEDGGARTVRIGHQRKRSGSGVEVGSVTAEGFFTAPGSPTTPKAG